MALVLTVGHHLCAQEVAASKVTLAAAFNHPVVSESARTAIPEKSMVHRLAALFPGATDPQWNMLKSSYYVSFMHHGQKGTAVFTPKGALSYALVDCSQAQLPAAFRKKIAQDYPVYTFLHATQIHAHGAVAHQAVLENKEGYLTLKATAEGIEAQHMQKSTH